AQNVLTKANETPLKLEGNLLKVSTVFEPTHDRSILLAKNLKPETSKETFQNFVEATKNVDVFNVVFGKNGKAIVILKTEIDEDDSNEDMKLAGSIISLEFAPLTKGIKISNIPPGTNSDDISFKFSNKYIGGDQVTDLMLDKKNGVAKIYFEKTSVVSGLVKKEHKFRGVSLNVIPYYDDFEELQEITTKITVFSAAYPIDPLVMNYIFNKQEIEKKFDFKTMKYDKQTSRFHFTKDFDNPKLAHDFDNKLKEFLHSFVKEEVKIPKAVFEKVKEVIEEKRDEFKTEKVDFSFDGYRVTFIGKEEDVTLQKRSAEATIDRISEEAKFETTELVIEDKNKLKFLNFINYFKNVTTEFPRVKIHGMENSSGKLSLLGTAEKIKDVQLRILHDLMKISEIDVKMSDRQIDFLKRTECRIVNDELKKDEVMLMLVSITGAVGAKGFQAKIMTLKKCDNTEEKRLLDIVHTKTSEKRIRIDEETASFLVKSNKLQDFKKEQFNKHQVLVDQELVDFCSIWIVCEKSKMNNVEHELTRLINEKKITSSTFKPVDPMKVRFLKEQCLGRIKEKEQSCKAEGVAVLEIDSGLLENQYSSVINYQGRYEPEDSANAVKIIYVSDIKDSTTEDSITLFFENKKRSGGGNLCEGKEGYKRLTATVARLTFVSSKDAQNVLTKANETPLKLEGNVLKVSTEFEPTHDRSILLAKNLKPETSKEMFQNFVEATRNVDVFNVVFGKDGKAIVILRGEDDSKEESSKEDMKLASSIISLEFAPLTKGIKISNIPPETWSDDIRYKFSNKKIGGGQVTDMMMDKRNGVANIYFEKTSVVSGLVKKEHKFKGVSLNVIPSYDDFEELQEITTKKTEYFVAYPIDPLVMNYIFNKQGIENKFDFKTMKYDKETSRFHFTKDFNDPQLAQEFENKLKEFLYSFVKDEVRIAKTVFGKIKEAMEKKRDEFEALEVNFSFDGYRVTLVGKKEDVTRQKRSVEATMDRFIEQSKLESIQFLIENKNKLKFLNFIHYFKKLMTEFPGVKIHGMENSSGKLSLLGTTERIKDVQLRVLQDLMKISEIDVKMSDRQIDFLKRSECQIVNDELKKDDVMLMLLTIKGAVGTKGVQARIMTLEKCDNYEEKRLLNIVHAKTSEKCIRVDEETASFLAKSNKLQEFKMEQFNKHQVLVDQELVDFCNIWIVCEKSKMNNVEQELKRLINEKKKIRSIFEQIDPHCWGRIKEKGKSCKAEGVAALEIDSCSLEVKGTQAGRKEMITFLETLAENDYFKNQYSSVVNYQGRNEPEDEASAVRTIYVSDIRDSTTEDSITLFFENTKRSGGGDLCEGKEGYKRLSATVARLTFVSSKGNSVSKPFTCPP
ncbi:poly [ADP-ribose] polymerase 14-like, partial [Paramuricea clavata]